MKNDSPPIPKQLLDMKGFELGDTIELTEFGTDTIVGPTERIYLKAMKNFVLYDVVYFKSGGEAYPFPRNKLLWADKIPYIVEAEEVKEGEFFWARRSGGYK